MNDQDVARLIPVEKNSGEAAAGERFILVLRLTEEQRAGIERLVRPRPGGAFIRLHVASSADVAAVYRPGTQLGRRTE